MRCLDAVVLARVRGRAIEKRAELLLRAPSNAVFMITLVSCVVQEALVRRWKVPYAFPLSVMTFLINFRAIGRTGLDIPCMVIATVFFGIVLALVACVLACSLFSIFYSPQGRYCASL